MPHQRSQRFDLFQYPDKPCTKFKSSGRLRHFADNLNDGQTAQNVHVQSDLGSTLYDNEIFSTKDNFEIAKFGFSL